MILNSSGTMKAYLAKKSAEGIRRYGCRLRHSHPMTAIDYIVTMTLSDKEYQQAVEQVYAAAGLPTRASDYTYQIPKIIQVFVERANNELPEGWTAHPHALLRQVNLTFCGEIMIVFSYDQVEDNIVLYLDEAIQMARAYASK